MGNIVTITNNYNNGVCNGFYVYTGTTFNGDPHIIPPSATLISSQLITTFPYDLNVGDYEGPLYVFLEHCDNYITPPPNINPKRQGGFQVQYIFIECPCPLVTIDCRMTATFEEINVVTTDCDISATFEEIIQPTSTPIPTSTSTPVPTSTSTPLPTPTLECVWTATFSEFE